MTHRIRWATTIIVAATAVTLGLSSASATTPTPTPGPSVPAGATGHPSAGNAFDPATYRPARPESIFTPITPCRISDTRKAGGPLANLAVRSFYVRGTTHFAPQGGTSGGCGVPTAATAVATNVTVAGASGSGYLSGYPSDAGEPNTNFITYQGRQNITANPILPLSRISSPDLNIRNHGTSSAQVIIDVTGYYLPPIQGLVGADGTVYSGSSRILSATRTAKGIYEVSVDSDVPYCTPHVTIFDASGWYASAYDLNVYIVTVNLWQLNSTGAPVPADPSYFYLTVTC